MIGQYSLGGPDNKRTILRARAPTRTSWSALAAGRRPVHRLGHDPHLCLPTCHDAQRVTERHLVDVPLVRGRGAAGYRAVQALPAR